MLANDSDKAWEYYGKADPYFAVLTHDVFRKRQITGQAQAEFFESGQRYVEWIVSTLRSELAPGFAPERGLDFGCGVGRLTLPLANVCKSIVGVNVSESMLETATKHAVEQGVKNADFVKSDDDLTRVTGQFDFVHSLIVFQHIPRDRGEAILKRLVSLLRDDGIGALHFTCSWSSEVPVMRRLLVNAYRIVPALHGLRNLAKGRPFREPMMQMNRYDLNRLLRILQESGCHRLQVRFTETGYFGHGFYGVILLFQKRKLDVSAHA